MNSAQKVESFIKIKLKENNLKRVHIAQEAHISGYTINNITNGNQKDVAFKTVLKLANFFDCTTDEVLGRENLKVNNYPQVVNKVISTEMAMDKIKNFITLEMKNLNLDVSNFARKCGLKKWAFRGFAYEENKQQSLGSNYILAIVDTYNISLDELIGRSKPIDISKETTISHDLNTPSNNNKLIPQKDPSDHFKSLEKIQETLRGYVLTNDKTSNTHQTPMPKVPTKHKNNSPSK